MNGHRKEDTLTQQMSLMNNAMINTEQKIVLQLFILLNTM